MAALAFAAVVLFGGLVWLLLVLVLIEWFKGWLD